MLPSDRKDDENSGHLPEPEWLTNLTDQSVVRGQDLIYLLGSLDDPSDRNSEVIVTVNS